MDSKSFHWDCIAGKSDATFGIIVSASFKQIRHITTAMFFKLLYNIKF